MKDAQASDDRRHGENAGPAVAVDVVMPSVCLVGLPHVDRAEALVGWTGGVQHEAGNGPRPKGETARLVRRPRGGDVMNDDERGRGEVRLRRWRSFAGFWSVHRRLEPSLRWPG